MKKYILLIIIIGFGTTSCSDYLDSEYIFKDRESLEKIFTDYDKTEQWLARAYSFLTGQCCDVGSKRNTPFVFDDCMYYGDDDVTIDASKGGNMSYNKFHEGGYDEGAFQDTWDRCYNTNSKSKILFFILFKFMFIRFSNIYERINYYTQSVSQRNTTSQFFL